MAIKIAINGYGRIGRNILRAIFESGRNKEFDVVAINDLGNSETNAHLTKYDTAHGRFPGEVVVDGSDMIVNGDRIKVFAERDPSKLPWGENDVDVVLECTGFFASKEKASAHIAGGASSCTTNCLAPMVKVLHEKIGVVNGLMTTVHAYTNDQVLTDVYHSDLRRARSATMSMIPTSTGAAKAVGLVLPELNGKLDGFSVRVPTINVSLVDLAFVAKRDTSVEEVNQVMKDAADGKVIAFTDEPLVSSDFNHVSTSSNFDAGMTRVNGGTLVKCCSWYDNEWGFSNRMLDTTVTLMNAK